MAARKAPQTSSRMDRDLIGRTLDALVSTVAILKTTVTALQTSVELQAQTIAMITETVFGREDPTTLKHVPGLRDRVNSHESVFKWVLIGGGSCLGLVTLHSLGLPTELIGKALQAWATH